MVAAKARFPHHHIDRTLSMNAADLETMTVTEKYLDGLLSGRNEAEEVKQEQAEGVSLLDVVRGLGAQGMQMQGGAPGTMPGFIIGPAPDVDPNEQQFPPDGQPPWEEGGESEDEDQDQT